MDSWCHCTSRSPKDRPWTLGSEDTPPRESESLGSPGPSTLLGQYHRVEVPFYSPWFKPLTPGPGSEVWVWGICLPSVIIFYNFYSFILVKWVGQVSAASWWGWENWGMKRLNDLFNVTQGICDKVQCSLFYPLLGGTQRATQGWDRHVLHAV